MNTHRLNANSYLSLAGNHLNFFEITGRESTSSGTAPESFSDWGENTLDIDEFKVIPFGKSNDIPQQIQEAVLPNSLGHRLQKRKTELLVEQGPYIYQDKVDGTKYFREPVEDEPMLQWLESIQYENLLLDFSSDFYHQNMVCAKIYRERSGRLQGTSAPAQIEYQESFDCRLAYKKSDKRKKPTHMIVGDWVKQDKKELAVYPLFDVKEPTKYPVAIHYVKLGAYGVKHYPLPDIFSSLDWMKNSSNTPKIFKNFMDNALNIKWHIQSPAKFWEDKKTIIQENCRAAQPPIQFKQQMVEDLKTEILDNLSTLLSGIENVGKFWHNEYVVQQIGGSAQEQGWKITPIEQKTKEFVESQILIYNTASFAVQAGVGLHASLAMVGADGKSDSGSEQQYAWDIHKKTATPIPEYFVCKIINDIAKIKFNNRRKIGFYHTEPIRLQDITNSQRPNPTTSAPAVTTA